VRIAVLGSGTVGRTVAPALARLGHEVRLGTRDPDATRNREDWTPTEPDVDLAAFGTVAEGADLVVNATSGNASLAALGSVGAETLSGTVVLDLANVLDASGGFPPAVGVGATDSLAEQIQRAFPEARVVKALNTVTAAVMVDPGRVGDGGTTAFVAADDAEARGLVVGLLEQLGWRDVVEFDQLAAARGLETYVSLWLQLMVRLGTPDFNVALVR
jgi:predicted dinucleotide-binding enzyme